MAINQNHTCEELNGIKCAIVEKNIRRERANFLDQILTFNGFTVVVVPSPASKTAPQVSGDALPSAPSLESPPAPETFTMGVTDLTFNPINAIFGRLLKTQAGHVVTLSYWQQKDTRSRDEIPYFEA